MVYAVGDVETAWDPFLLPACVFLNTTLVIQREIAESGVLSIGRPLTFHLDQAIAICANIGDCA